ncbi:bifunctional adenosylcobinamide kinase/adenosylcobinamide-phosphate guanylyltransferase [Marinivivus vitaminiproducens]|uniref:bifunctional adenosylcobinamide kinase/adenosylcobinamide-phosphate guanylyltransferase n=1 Tax=Marinivivus vitaminiproducens TaxID=3035935 RepID=UPI003FA00C07
MVLASGLTPVYVATGQAGDAEMAARIARHRTERDAAWRTVEEPVELAAALRREAAPDRAVLVDCLTLWLTNLLMQERDVPAAGRELVTAVTNLPGPVVLVSNEVGQGVVPTASLARAFVDHAGRLHQALAAQAQRVVLITAGLPLTLKDTSSGATG